MKQIIKMFLCLLAVLGITVALAPQTVFADEEYGGLKYTVKNEEATITGYTSELSGNVNIPDKLGGYPVTSIENLAFEFCQSLTSVTIPDTMTTIGDCAFGSCHSLTSVTIPDSVTSIGNGAFQLCDTLTSVTIPDSMTDIEIRLFQGCQSLTSVTIPDSVTTIGDYAFEYCYNLTDIYYTGTQDQWNALPKGTGWDNYCPLNQQVHCGIYSYTVNSEDEVTITGYSGPGGDVRIPSKLGGNPVTSIGDSVFLPASDTLTSVSIPGSVTNIGNRAFGECGILTSVTIPDSVTTIGDYAFSDCINLAAINYGGSKTQWDSMTSTATDWNYNCPSDQVINYGAWDVKITAGANMAATSGEPVQVVKKATDMASVTFTAATGFYFPADYSVPNLPDGLSMARNNDGTQITVSGKPKADADIALPAATVKDTPATTFIISFDANGGGGKMETVTGISGEYTLPECTFTAPKDQAFDCWMAGNGTFAPGEKITVNADTTVTAQWKDAPPMHVHTRDLVEAKEATCTEDGNKAYYTCSGCSKWFEDYTALIEIEDKSSVIIKAGHKLTHVQESPVTCEKDGNIEYYICDACGKWFRDSEATDPIGDKSSVIIKALGHTWDNGVITKVATSTRDGVKTYTCLRDSSHIRTELLPKRERSDSNHDEPVFTVSPAEDAWLMDGAGWHYRENGILVKNAWRSLKYNEVSYWYLFDENGTMKTGWAEWQGERYYLSPVSDGRMGHMLTGWQQIDGKWYYFETAEGSTQGRMYRNEKTPDGRLVGADGALIEGA